MEWDSPEWREERNKKLLAWLKDDFDAFMCVLGFSAISETWDDLIDGDKKPSPEEINRAFLTAIVHLNANRFYVRHCATILPVVFIGINSWFDANELEKSTKVDHRALAFYIRNYCYEIVSICAFCVGGFDWLRSISLEMRMFFQHESYFTWEKKV